MAADTILLRRIAWRGRRLDLRIHVTGGPVLFRWLDVFELRRRRTSSARRKPAADITRETFGVTPVAESKEKTGFVIAGKNSTESLARLTEIHGRPIAALERDMRPGALARAGFLGDKEKLLDVLALDNRTVVDKLGRSHAELAMPLRILGTYAQEKATKEPIEFVYRGRRFQARLRRVAKAHIESPFADDLSTNGVGATHQESRQRQVAHLLDDGAAPDRTLWLLRGARDVVPGRAGRDRPTVKARGELTAR